MDRVSLAAARVLVLVGCLGPPGRRATGVRGRHGDRRAAGAGRTGRQAFPYATT